MNEWIKGAPKKPGFYWLARATWWTNTDSDKVFRSEVDEFQMVEVMRAHDGVKYRDVGSRYFFSFDRENPEYYRDEFFHVPMPAPKRPEPSDLPDWPPAKKKRGKK